MQNNDKRMSLSFELPSGELHSSLQYHNICVYITLLFTINVIQVHQFIPVKAEMRPPNETWVTVRQCYTSGKNY